MTGENAWVTEKALGFMGAILFILVVFRDLDVLVDPKELDSIRTMADFEGKKKLDLNLTLLSKYLNFQSAIDLVYCFRALTKEGKGFGKLLKKHHEKNIIAQDAAGKQLDDKGNLVESPNAQPFELDPHLNPSQSMVKKQFDPNLKQDIPGLESLLKEHPKHKTIASIEDAYLFPLVNFLRNHSIDCSNEEDKPVYDKVANADVKKQNNYAVDPWTEALETFGNPAVYGSIFNKEYPDITILDAIRLGKIVVVSLPSMQNSEDKNAKIGKMITSLIKGALGDMLSEGEMEGTVVEKEQQKRLRPYKLPYMLIFDEISNYGTSAMGQISSMCRSIGTDNGGIGLMVSGQSKSDLDKIGENNIAGRQLISNMGIKYFLNLGDEESSGYKEFASNVAGKKWTYEISDNLYISKGKESNEQDLTANLERKQVQWFDPEFFDKKLKKQTGEGIIMQNGFSRPEQIVANFIEAKKPFVRFHDTENQMQSDRFVLAKNISHKKLMSYFTLEDETPTNQENYKKENHDETNAA